MVQDASNSNLVNFFLGIIAVFVTGVMLLELQTVLMPFVIAMLLSIIFKPIILGLREKRIPMVIALFGVLLLFLCVLFLMGWVLFASADTFVRELPKYEAKIAVIADQIEASLMVGAERFNLQTSDFQWSDAIDLNSVTSALTTGLGSFLSFVATTFMVVLFMLFILAGSGDLGKKVRLSFPEDVSSKLASVIKIVDSQVRQYLVTKTLVSLSTGFLTWLALLLLGVDFPLVFGFIAFVLNYIPNVGSTVAVLFPFGLTLLQFETATVPLLVILGLGGIQMIMGNVIEPRIMGYSLNLSPLLILVSLIFWGWLWGVWGMVLAVPLTSTIKIVFENLESTRRFARLMNGSVD
ncbi:AI-2E family transporter [bacterium]|nr:AI-2E family transporter [bacterium]